ncbi:carbohydrate kinase, YjeF related protein [Pseudopedobacter saltans DSM 12145]|uniref:Bifunctional NAD(P)H-hydrate repair enzyme n=1 Tax=Pseudopedobacter saltans (strain ATCC 51119 / DSM 12145 / JCM 21818 / CCUG 39354 / LMG 10337 / NBRC 100064 / NCIMB 13643) TaxID=762903 RepID=F0SE74_PSESL|nr:bifunctional ADP-dependent NAD(P)H-hydrate dehydratase/NAD(P)H-hydrate epimerase [Pseudopedobacter saltans]ADY53996.1 carbohydrate kinase, YjeF related protein [Pseudopedobacter saltans DSM 12145]
MLKLLNAEQTKLADQYTIENEPIPSLELMERASYTFVKTFSERFLDKKKTITIFCGKRNNGGDGLAIARLLHQDRYEFVDVVIVDFSDKSTPEFDANLIALQQTDVSIFYLKNPEELEGKQTDVIIDAIFGIGLSRELDQSYQQLIEKLNLLSGKKISVDIPSGMPSEGRLYGNVIFKADWVITFQRPKLNFLLPLSAPYIKEWKVVNIGLNEHFIENTASPYYWIWKKDISDHIKVRKSFDHKGTYGHNLIIAGDIDTMGAALLTAESSMKSGSGLTTACIPQSGITALNARLPEVMYLSRENLDNTDLDKYSSICIGPGLGKTEEAKAIIIHLISTYKKPIVFDADALNILAEDENLLSQIPLHSILTPHIKEFDRLFGEHHNCWDRIETAFRQAQKLQSYIVLKNRYTMIFTPTGLCYFNSSGSPAMAIGGMGDVLTGMISSFIAQDYPIENAIIIAVFLHGYIGEQLGQKMYVVPPTKLIKQIPYVIKDLKS